MLAHTLVHNTHPILRYQLIVYKLRTKGVGPVKRSHTDDLCWKKKFKILCNPYKIRLFEYMVLHDSIFQFPSGFKLLNDNTNVGWITCFYFIFSWAQFFRNYLKKIFLNYWLVRIIRVRFFNDSTTIHQCTWSGSLLPNSKIHYK